MRPSSAPHRLEGRSARRRPDRWRPASRSIRPFQTPAPETPEDGRWRRPSRPGSGIPNPRRQGPRCAPGPCPRRMQRSRRRISACGGSCNAAGRPSWTGGACRTMRPRPRTSGDGRAPGPCGRPEPSLRSPRTPWSTRGPRRPRPRPRDRARHEPSARRPDPRRCPPRPPPGSRRTSRPLRTGRERPRRCRRGLSRGPPSPSRRTPFRHTRCIRRRDRARTPRTGTLCIAPSRMRTTADRGSRGTPADTPPAGLRPPPAAVPARMSPLAGRTDGSRMSCCAPIRLNLVGMASSL